LSDNRKKSRRKEGRERMDRRVGDRRANGVPPAPDTPARHDTGHRRRKVDSKVAGASKHAAKTAAKATRKRTHTK
jgi:hypothetical protein